MLNFRKLSKMEKDKKLQKLQMQNPKKIPTIFESKKFSKKTDNIKTFKFLLSPKMKLQKIALKIRKRINLKKDKSLFFYSNNKILKMDDNFQNLYDQFKDNDGFLYVFFDTVKSFGN